jgi:hypothetical protein
MAAEQFGVRWLRLQGYCGEKEKKEGINFFHE